MNFIEMCTGVYQIWDNEHRCMKTSHMLYALSDQGVVYKNTKDGWIALEDLAAQKDEAPWN